ncbi:hypothetical protein CN495_07775 [Bacillus thuringiensis]|uniref:Terminase n=1 Tax=Bacillus thuringiensis TaxID=1428 RepID=A0ABD6S730_BACTU|nr:hypothetical protein [Bacillus thuringiensis]PER55643.1 hypothetical protein CN495_07775 [Bacillus thuringiensis]
MKNQYTVILTSASDENIKILDIGIVAIDKGNALKQVIRKFPNEIENCGEIMIYEDMPDWTD